MGWDKSKTVNKIVFKYWHVGTIKRNNTKHKTLLFQYTLYKDEATYKGDESQHWQENIYEISSLSGDNYPLSSEDLKVEGKDFETLVYEKIKQVGELPELPGVDFSDAVLN